MELEIIGTLVGLIYLWLEYKASIYLWIAGIIYDIFIEELVRCLFVAQSTSEVLKRIARSLDLVPAQVRAWLTKAERDNIVRQTECLVGRTGKPRKMLELIIDTNEKMDCQF